MISNFTVILSTAWHIIIGHESGVCFVSQETSPSLVQYPIYMEQGLFAVSK